MNEQDLGYINQSEYDLWTCTSLLNNLTHEDLLCLQESVLNQIENRKATPNRLNLIK